LIYGNLEKEQALKIGQYFEQNFMIKCKGTMQFNKDATNENIRYFYKKQ